MDVLLVDDEPDFLDQAKIFLERRKDGMSVETATSAEEAMELLERKDYGAVVSDIRMNGMNGIEFLKNLREGGNDVPFIVLTGKGDEEAAMEALNLGADRYFQKGGDSRAKFAMLAEAVNELVEGRRIAERDRLLQSFVWRNFIDRTRIVKGYLEILEDYEGEDPKGFFKILEMLIDEEEKHLEMLERIRKFRVRGISPFGEEAPTDSEDFGEEEFNREK